MPNTPLAALPYPAPTDPVSDGAANIQALATALDKSIPQIVAAIPAAPVNGQEIILVDSLTVPTYAWHLRYSTAITDANKWVFVGGSPARVEVITNETTGSTVAVDLATVCALPAMARAGLYDISFGASLYGPTNDVWAYAVIKIGAAAASVNDAIFVRPRAGDMASVARSMRRTLAAADVLKLQHYLSAAGGTMQAEKRWIEARPVRIA